MAVCLDGIGYIYYILIDGGSGRDPSQPSTWQAFQNQTLPYTQALGQKPSFCGLGWAPSLVGQIDRPNDKE